MTAPLAPVLLLTWSRPEETQQTLVAIRRVRPNRLFIAGDGPRNSDDRLQIDHVGNAINRLVDWPFELRTDFADENLGCRRGVTLGLDWFFSHVDEGIILKGGCVAHPDFFSFCTAMLDRYRDDSRVMHIAGDNTARIAIEQDWSYCFVPYPHIWGWATWRRAWSLYDRDMTAWQSFRSQGQLEDTFPDRTERETWVPIFDRLADEGRPDTLDWQWSATCMLRNGLCVQPTHNFILNMGFNERATHALRKSDRASASTSGMYPLTHPPFAYRHGNAERQIYLNTRIGLHPEHGKTKKEGPDPWFRRTLMAAWSSFPLPRSFRSIVRTCLKLIRHGSPAR